MAGTHTAIWYLSDDSRLFGSAGEFLDQAASGGLGIAISSIRLAEIVYLTEKGRIASNVDRGIRTALADPSPVFREASLTAEVVEAMGRVPRSDVPYMPDRIVAATALFVAVPAISRDGQFRTSNVGTIW